MEAGGGDGYGELGGAGEDVRAVYVGRRVALTDGATQCRRIGAPTAPGHNINGTTIAVR